MGRSELAFREAFERLKSGAPERLMRGTNVSQNNVAKEAGCDPSALKKSRFPTLVAEIKRWIEDQSRSGPSSQRQVVLAQRNANKSLKARIDELKAERDHAFSLLAESDARILELIFQIAQLERAESRVPVIPIASERARPRR